ncbi:MAG: AmmeMemoRadiSam system radical SAM enzyme [Planctomycetaceae bacterium]|nr:AmmeMemoRadiSam system radical SAM enzyme [Planctomycetaceae bacterium]
MSRQIVLPPSTGLRPDGLYPGGWWHDANDAEGRIVCDLCPRECHLKAGDRGFCFVRQNVDGEMMLTTYGRSTGFCIDPIEKKPLNHFLPGTSVLSFGTAGCNLGCKFCQNWDISKSREVERLSELAGPEAIAEAASHFDCRSVAYTYNDPVVWAEYAIDTAKACRAAGIKNVAVTAAYISPQARAPFYEYMDAANVDLKAFTEDFYHKITYSHLQPVLETIEWLKKETDVWFELTNLVIPDANDSMDEIREMSDWILQHVGDEVPVHFTAFHPDFRMKDRGNTPPETLIAAREVALQQGLRFVYVGNVNDVAHQSTYCPSCKGLLIQRNWYELGQYSLKKDACGHCGARIAGVFEAAPGNWGRRRQPVQMSQFAKPLPIIQPEAVVPLNANTPPLQSANALPRQSHSEEEPKTMTTQTPTDGKAARIDAQRPKLTDEQKSLIHHAACEIMAASIIKRPGRVEDPTLAGAAEKTVMGAFVTLKRQGRLRACCGALGKPMPLGNALTQSAIRTATEDARLPTISRTELPHLDVDVSLLYGFQPIKEKGEDRIAAVEPGRHGLQINMGNAGGLLLPSVAIEQGYEAEEFLRQVCRKAGLPDTAWKDDAAVIQTFESCSISGKFDASTLSDVVIVRPLLTTQELQTLAAHCGRNIVALAQGATPSYYLNGVSEGTVNGIALTIKPENSPNGINFFRMAMRPGMPLQSSCMNLCEAAANALKSGQVRLSSPNVSIAISVLHDPAMHGTIAHPDIRGIDPKTRGLMILEGNKSAWVFDPSMSVDELFAEATKQVNVFNPEAANIFSFIVESTEPKISISNAPQAATGGETRPAAVAGKFYPSDPDELSKLIDDCLGEIKGRKRKASAIMVPHAGLIYSGKTAGDVFSKIKIPSTVIIVGPKHTRAGVEWAVAPHETWSIPGAELKSDRELAQKLCDAIPGLQMDAAAHQGEHGIEVELPFIAKLNPDAKVVGIAIGGGTMERCREFASGLVKVLEGMDEMPLLIISSDMNHYAAEEENRRKDELAMEALEARDAEKLLQTCVDNQISMCGVLPAVMIMEALKEMDSLNKATRLGYTTSAETSGDTSRVVGYCGMLFS